MRRDRQADQTQHADGLAAFVDEHDGEREQEDRGRKNRDRGDGIVKALEHGERAHGVAGEVRAHGAHAWHAGIHVPYEGVRIGRVDERDVDPVDRFGAGGLLR